ncbi:hypothetical protein OKA04_23050 [Luteolibacter flavescens]|uniref:DUF4175 domain-containing protein n=1 Tax=Luteolibacter flavescens TaxID=1859460 RepID=A0ABT3FVM5_9BACT|nr:hypothetical protein [Luteolibacter flavescens]MCW1887634.1 hypothetical protein [Luteolibacter flavescens]
MNTSLLSFLDAVRRRLDRGIASRIGARCLLAAAGTCLVWAVAWRAFGYAAPRVGYAVALGLALLVFVIALIASRRNSTDAALAADETFGLKDGLLSWLGFRSKGGDGEVYQLQERMLAARVSSLDPAGVPLVHPKRSYGIGVLLAVIAAVLAFLPHSQAVRDRIASEELTAMRSAEVKKQVEEAVEELIKDLGEEERKVLDPAKLRELAKQLAETKDQREAEKQIAKFEQELAKAMQGLEARQDEAVIKLSAEELAKSSLADARQLGKQLDAKDFEKAKQELGEMKPEGKEKMTPEELEQLKKNAAKAKEMAKRMADGARQRNFGKKMKPGDKMDGEQMQANPGNQQPLQEMLDEMDADARQLGAKLEQGEFDPDAEAMAMKLGEKMDKLGDRLGQLGARQKAKDKLGKLRAGMSEARQFAQGQSQTLGLGRSMAQGQQPGGKQAGRGSVESRRDGRDELKDNNNRAEIKGNPNGEGPSSNTVESAESGTGIAGRAGVAKQRDFRRQMESLVRRDDIPEELKLGVREYFERVHETGDAPAE